jgi:hypothetical protein
MSAAAVLARSTSAWSRCPAKPRPSTAIASDSNPCRSWLLMGQSSRVARDQHQPASSRATATLAITGFLLRAVKASHPAEASG